MMTTGASATGRGWGAALALYAFAAIAGLAAPAAAQTGETVNVHQFALDHPVADVELNVTPSLGASVPPSIQLATVGDNAVYGYFYFQGRPVIVEMATRSIVRID